MKLIIRFVLFLGVFLLMANVPHGVGAYQHVQNFSVFGSSGRHWHAVDDIQEVTLHYRRSYIVSASSPHSNKAGGDAQDPAAENAEDEEQLENEDDNPAASKKQVKQGDYFAIPFSAYAAEYFDNCIRSRMPGGTLSYPSFYRCILYRVIRI